jgi:hypothetical protein
MEKHTFSRLRSLAHVLRAAVLKIDVAIATEDGTNEAGDYVSGHGRHGTVPSGIGIATE